MAQDYDKIFKENIEEIIIPLARKLLDISLIPENLEEVADDLQRTIERKPDFLKKVLHPNPADNYILHIEFQVDDKDNMIKRMLEYYAMCYRIHDLQLDQYVFYIGENQTRMSSELNHPNINFRFRLINFQDLDWHIFTESSEPEEVILAILAKFKKSQTDEVVTEILRKIQLTPIDTLRKQKCIVQLEILSQLRKLQLFIIEKIKSMAIVYDIKKDLRYIEGKEEGREEERKELLEKIEREKKEAIKKMLNKGLSYEQISEFLEVSIDFIKQVEQSI